MTSDDGTRSVVAVGRSMRSVGRRGVVCARTRERPYPISCDDPAHPRLAPSRSGVAQSRDDVPFYHFVCTYYTTLLTYPREIKK